MARTCPQCLQQHDAGAECRPVDAALPGGADPMVGQLLADRYRVLRAIGEGGMGRVYLAEHERMGRMSAVKVMSPALAATPDAISRFNREAANASRIHQPNVAAIYDFGETADGTLYLAMEYVEGETLTALLRREGPLAPQRVAELTGQVADGLHAAHHLGIVHRDLKPDNILVTRHHDGREWVKIVDFGIAKQVRSTDQTVTSLGVAIGTPEYMSPEQIAGEPLDARTDLYSLALVTFNMLTGQLPHPAMTSKQSLVQRLTERPRTLAEVAPARAWHPRLQKALDRALAPEPDDRYANVGDFARDVRAAVGLPSPMNAVTVTIDTADRPTTELRVRPPAGGRATVARPMVESPPASRGWGWLVAGVLVVALGGGGAVLKRDQLAALLDGRTRAAAHRPVVVQQGAPDSLGADPATDGVSTATTAGAPAALSPMDAGQRLERAALQAGRRAVGDSSDGGPHLAVMQSAEDDEKEIMVHVNRARDLTRTDRLQGAGLELRTAYEEYRIFLTEHASAPQVESLRRDLQSAMDDALAACNVARQADAADGGKAFRCEHPARTGVLMVYDSVPASHAP